MQEIPGSVEKIKSTVLWSFWLLGWCRSEIQKPAAGTYTAFPRTASG